MSNIMLYCSWKLIEKANVKELSESELNIGRGRCDSLSLREIIGTMLGMIITTL